MVRKFSADQVYTITGGTIEHGVVVCDEKGEILSIDARKDHDPASVERYSGALIPGFVNTHCHLELSHMKGLVDTGTGLLSFIGNVVTRRQAAAEVIADSIKKAEAEMLRNGIVAVGDISNTMDTFAAKAKGKLRYYTFVELFDFLQDAGAEKAFSDWKPVFDACPETDFSKKSMVPHAPYSVSQTLFSLLQKVNPPQQNTISIHNQETPAENALFQSKTGGFLDFYGKFGISLDAFAATGQTSIHYALQHLNPADRTLFVHNTLTTQSEIEEAQRWSPNTYWATCPNANLYIENRLPDYRAFMAAGARVTIGTDSLTSNWQLSILEEMKTIARYQRYVPFETLLTWATHNGALALGYDKVLGSIEPGKTPGLLLLKGLQKNGILTGKENLKRLI